MFLVHDLILHHFLMFIWIRFITVVQQNEDFLGSRILKIIVEKAQLVID